MRFIEYANYIGIKRQYVNKLFNEGRLNPAVYIDESTGSKRINPKIADRIFRGENVLDTLFDDEQILQDYRDKQTRKRIKNNSQFELEDENISEGKKESCTNFMSMTFEQARRMKVFYEAQSEKFKLEKEQGKFISVDEVKKEASRAGLLMRDKVLSVPAQISTLLTDMTSSFEIKNLLTEYLSKALEEAGNINSYTSKLESDSEESSQENTGREFDSMELGATA